MWWWWWRRGSAPTSMLGALVGGRLGLYLHCCGGGCNRANDHNMLVAWAENMSKSFPKDKRIRFPQLHLLARLQ